MYKFYSILFIIIFSLTNNFAQDSTMIEVGPGFKLHKVTKTVPPNNIRILEIDLTEPTTKITTTLARNMLGTGFERTSAMVARSSYEGHLVIGAVNGDFYGISAPTNPYTFLLGSSVMEREYFFGRPSTRSLFGITEGNKPISDEMRFTGFVRAANNSQREINAINHQRITNDLIIYSKYIGDNTRTNNSGTEIKIIPVETFNVNKNTKFIVIAIESNIGSMSILNNEQVLSGNGTAQEFLNQNIVVGDTIEIFLGTTPNRGDIVNLIGGGPRLVINGVRPNFSNTDVHPRTAVGFNQDSTKLYLLTVDGRQAGFSIGMSFEQLGDYMLSIGCYNAINLDGGGSTTMVVRDEIVNSPSDPGGERSVANALLAVATVSFEDIAENISLYPKNILIDITQKKKITINAKDFWDYPIELKPSVIDWELSGIDGTIDTSGYFIPASTGSGWITGRIFNLVDSVKVEVVSQPEGSFIINNFQSIDNFFNIEGNTVNQDSSYYFLNNSNFISPPSSLELHYDYQYIFGGHNRLILNCEIPVQGEPDSVGIFIVNDGHPHQYFLKVIDRDNEEFYLASTTMNKDITGWQYVRVRTANPFPLNLTAKFDFPLTITQIIIPLRTQSAANGQFYSGQFLFDDLKGVINNPVFVDKEEIIVTEYSLSQNYPNPFNPITKIKYSLPSFNATILRVYDILGREITTLVNEMNNPGNYEVEFNASELTSGIYYYTIKSGDFYETKKMILIR